MVWTVLRSPLYKVRVKCRRSAIKRRVAVCPTAGRKEKGKRAITIAEPSGSNRSSIEDRDVTDMAGTHCTTALCGSSQGKQYYQNEGEKAN